MKCVICKQGDTQPDQTTVTFQREGTTLIFKRVPAQVCANCGEAYVDEDVAAQLLRAAGTAASAGVELGIREFAPATA